MGLGHTGAPRASRGAYALVSFGEPTAAVCINMSEMFAPDLPFKSCRWVSASGGFPAQSLSRERLSRTVLAGKGPEPRLPGGWRCWEVDESPVARTVDGDRTHRTRSGSELQGSCSFPPSSSHLLWTVSCPSATAVTDAV